MQDWCLEVWGDYACFTRPEMKVERVSYDVITPSASRAIFEAILWKPAIRWNVTKIEVLNSIRWISVRRNEVGKKASILSSKQFAEKSATSIGLFVEDERQQRAGLFLKNVKYRIHAYFDFIPIEKRNTSKDAATDETEAKYAAMFERRAKKGQCFHRPYLGCREFSCDFKLVDPETESAMPIGETRDLGFMLYDMNFEQDVRNPMPEFFRAIMAKGTINADRRKIEVRR